MRGVNGALPIDWPMVRPMISSIRRRAPSRVTPKSPNARAAMPLLGPRLGQEAVIPFRCGRDQAGGPPLARGSAPGGPCLSDARTQAEGYRARYPPRSRRSGAGPWFHRKATGNFGEPTNQLVSMPIEQDAALLIVSSHQSESSRTSLYVIKFGPGELDPGHDPTEPSAVRTSNAQTPVVDVELHERARYPKGPPPAAAPGRPRTDDRELRCSCVIGSTAGMEGEDVRYDGQQRENRHKQNNLHLVPLVPPALTGHAHS